MTNRLLHILDSYYPLEEVSAGEFFEFKAGGKTFYLQVFQAEGLGHVCVLQSRSFFGLMKRDILIINPLYLDLPLYSYDRIRFLILDKLIVELYNTIISDFCSEELHRVKRRYSYLRERGTVRHWYDSLKLPSSFRKKSWIKNSTAFDNLTWDHFAAYLSASGTKTHDPEEKKEKSAYFAKNFLQNSGPEIKALHKKLGSDKVRLLFMKYIFGIEG